MTTSLVTEQLHVSVTRSLYLLALLICNATKEPDKSLGTAVRLGVSNSQFQFEVTNVIHSVLSCSGRGSRFPEAIGWDKRHLTSR